MRCIHAFQRGCPAPTAAHGSPVMNCAGGIPGALYGTLCASAGEGLPVHEAARMQTLGRQIDELAQWKLAHRMGVCRWLTAEIFEHLRHGAGRCCHSSCREKIKPLSRVDQEGCLKVTAKPGGLKQAIRSRFNCLETGGRPEISNLVMIAHGGHSKDALPDRHPLGKTSRSKNCPG